jgi:hypothetical protein
MPGCDKCSIDLLQKIIDLKVCIGQYTNTASSGFFVIRRWWKYIWWHLNCF